ncbi:MULTISPECIES: hypothetical protein [Halobacterium]|uniref:hypothetical protein n=1 Tax=Halobacterium TaxID=2239 RepID=UPI00073EC99E|nr:MULTISPECIES: hypothetical protein [Halobacterium]MCG1004918.1 hypothetical protein [Halobacterium noricense]
MGFEEPEDFLDAEAVSEAIADQAEWYFEDDQIGKSWDIMQVILEYAEEYDLVERNEKQRKPLGELILARFLVEPFDESNNNESSMSSQVWQARVRR